VIVPLPPGFGDRDHDGLIDMMDMCPDDPTNMCFIVIPPPFVPPPV
jgi:hypothetical protein